MFDSGKDGGGRGRGGLTWAWFSSLSVHDCSSGVGNEINSDMYKLRRYRICSALDVYAAVLLSYFFSIVLFNEWPCHGATLPVHNYTTVSVKIAGRLYCLLAFPMLVLKIWWVKRDKQHSERDRWRRARSKKKRFRWKCPNYFCLRLYM